MKAACLYQAIKKDSAASGAVLAEIIMVLFIISMFTLMVMMNFSGVLSRDSFRNRAGDLVNLFQMAETGAAQTGARYEIIIDFIQNSYLLREIKTGLVAVEDVSEDEIIQTGQFNDRFQLYYVMFDDGQWTNDAPALFRVGKNGWQYGGKVVVTDSDGKEYSIVINRLSRKTDIVEGDVPILIPRTEDEMGF
jgi:Tfp pilus assembly protein FimT